MSGIRFKRYKGALRSVWRRLTEEDIENAGLSEDVLATIIQQRHGVAKEIARRHVSELQRLYLA